MFIKVKEMYEHNSALYNTSFQQEPGANGTEIFNGIQYVRPGSGFVPNFKLFKKIEVNGDKEEPLYTFLKVHTTSFVFYQTPVAYYKQEYRHVEFGQPIKKHSYPTDGLYSLQN
jgi:glutathione peroxidase